MSTLEARWFVDSDDRQWEELVAASVNGTFLHSRRYLGYHGDRFVDRSVVLLDGDRLLAVLPAAEDPARRDVVVSHPGITYGGFVLSRDGQRRGVSDLLDATLPLLRSAGYRDLVYKAVPTIYHRVPARDDEWALWQRGAEVVRRDLSATIDLDVEVPWATLRRRTLKKAASAGVEVDEAGALSDLWPVLTRMTADRHGVSPTHELDEIELLAERFPEEISCLVARLPGGEVVAGAVLYDTPSTSHTQYLTSSEAGMGIGALDAVIDVAIRRARRRGCRYLDFGISTESRGRVLNAGLHNFKTGFGAGATVVEHLALPLEVQPERRG